MNRVGQIPSAPRGYCRNCGKEVMRPKRNWCSQRCVTDALVKKGDVNAVRREVFARDRGVCAQCGIDCGLIERVIHRLGTWRVSHQDRESGRYAAAAVDVSMARALCGAILEARTGGRKKNGSEAVA